MTQCDVTLFTGHRKCIKVVKNNAPEIHKCPVGNLMWPNSCKVGQLDTKTRTKIASAVVVVVVTSGIIKQDAHKTFYYFKT